MPRVVAETERLEKQQGEIVWPRGSKEGENLDVPFNSSDRKQGKHSSGAEWRKD